MSGATVTTASLDTDRPVRLDEGPAAAIVSVHADIRTDVVQPLRKALAAAVNRRGHVVLDLTDASTMDPAGLGLLVRAHRRARRQGALICLVAPSRFIVTVLHTMRLDGVFPVFEDCTTAQEWLRALRQAEGRCTAAT